MPKTVNESKLIADKFFDGQKQIILPKGIYFHTGKHTFTDEHEIPLAIDNEHFRLTGELRLADKQESGETAPRKTAAHKTAAHKTAAHKK